ncbi:MAG: thiamine-phosphate kinase [Sphingomonas sp.]
MNEAQFIAALRTLPLHNGAHGLMDDAARLGLLVLTTDTLVEGVHFLSDDPAADVAWKLVATTLSDLAAKGATPLGVLLNYPLSDDSWDGGFLAGFSEALLAIGGKLLGGDTVALPAGAPRVLSLTAVGEALDMPWRTGARSGDALYVTGTIGDAGPGLACARRGAPANAGEAALIEAYRRPVPLLAEGRALAPHVHAMMDVSDGLLLDAARMAQASGLSVTIDLASLPLSAAFRAYAGDDRAARIAAATAGDDYQLLFAMPHGVPVPVTAHRVGSFGPGSGIALLDGAAFVPLPASLGFQHGG